MPLLILLLLITAEPERTRPYVIFGLSPEMSDQDLRQRYPDSAHQSNFVRLSESETHDGIGSINLYRSSGYNSLRIDFHRGDRSHPSYQSCDAVLATLEDDFGKPTTSRPYREERMSGDAYTWRSSTATLALNCVDDEAGKSLAEAIRSSVER